MRALFTLAITSLLLAGCGGSSGPETATVTGTVTLDGQPLSDATVLFVPENGRPAGGVTDAQGKYTLEFKKGQPGAIPGTNKVRISTAKAATDDGQPAVPEKVPTEYNLQTTLSFDVKDGEANVADFALMSGGDLPKTGFDDEGD